MKSNSLKITFILPNIRISGGVKAVFEFANNLCQFGHEVFVVYPTMESYTDTYGLNLRTLKRKIFEFSNNLLFNSQKLDWFELKAKLLRVPTLKCSNIPDADVVIATWWETAYNVQNYSKEKGLKFYLSQHYELWGGPKDKVDNSFKLGLKTIVNSRWLKDIIEKDIGAPVESLIGHVPDFEQFYPEEPVTKEDALRILMPYRNLRWKGVREGIKTFELAREKCREIKLVMFGPLKGSDIPEHAEFHENPSNDQLRTLYSSCDIFLFPSLTEGFAMPPMEAMRCKTAVLATRVGAISDYTIEGQTAITCEAGDCEDMAQKLIKLIADKALREKIAENGYQYITQNFSWEKATLALQDVFLTNLK